MIQFLVRYDQDNIPNLVLRRYTDQDGVWHSEYRTARKREWEEYVGIDWSGAGGSADWETVTPEAFAEIQLGWGYDDDPLAGI
jgi:hypothetical protein